MSMIRLVGSKKMNSFAVFLSVIKKLKKRSGVCVLLSKPYSAVEKKLTQAVDPKKVFFIDTANNLSQGDNVVSLPIEDLTGLSLAIDQAFQVLPRENPFLVFDAFSLFTLHNDPKTVAKFALFLIKTMRARSVETIIVRGSEGMNPELQSVLEQAADKVETVS